MKFQRNMERRCVVCGRKWKILIKDKKGHYSGGNYFGKIEIFKKYKNTGRFVKFDKMKFGTVKGIGKPKMAEYWECDKCFRG